MWLVGADPEELKKCPMIMERIRKCKEVRENSVAAGIRKFADTPTLFAQRTQPVGEPFVILAAWSVHHITLQGYYLDTKLLHPKCLELFSQFSVFVAELMKRYQKLCEEKK